METIGANWKNFVEKSKARGPAPQIFLEEAKKDFDYHLDILGNNERPTTLAVSACLQYPDYDVASFLDVHVREALSQQ